jgi:hypothetical protein
MELLFLLPRCEGSFFEMSLKNNSIYTPGKISISAWLTDESKINGNYQLQVSVYNADILVRKQVMQIVRTTPIVFELNFPAMENKTSIRCRTELFIENEFVEAKEMALTLWPSDNPYTENSKDRIIWVFDVSGQLQMILSKLEVEFTDASFQAPRDFQEPEIVLIGQNLDSKSMLVITNRLALVKNKPVVIFLQQKQLLENGNLEILQETNSSADASCDFNSILLENLNSLDLLTIIKDSVYIKANKKKFKEETIKSFITELTGDNNDLCSYLLYINDEKQTAFYCQLPITDSNDPRSTIILKNLLKIANTFCFLRRLN